MATNKKTALQRSTQIPVHDLRWQVNSFVECKVTGFIVKVVHGTKKDGGHYSLLRVKTISITEEGEQKSRLLSIFVPDYLISTVQTRFPKSQTVPDVAATFHLGDMYAVTNTYNGRTYAELRWVLNHINFTPEEGAGREYLEPKSN
ncbi:hypothetical protein KGD82_27935 (plasmid) [Nocardiopsis eucommiae]|uniref:Uncharacterized protein n=1 Tax=Nocardiopsis eucommiae TaxID=2831970 RepID=A0A975LCS5_9ACTN|nr:hypothetical protein KGD82_27935 [Nocardiopsis eucommiae]